jgi:hypothetical protein
MIWSRKIRIKNLFRDRSSLIIAVIDEVRADLGHDLEPPAPSLVGFLEAAQPVTDRESELVRCESAIHHEHGNNLPGKGLAGRIFGYL